MTTDRNTEVDHPVRPGSRGQERRSGLRREAVSRRARVAWRSGLPPYPSAPARLIDISEGGAQLLTDVTPPDLLEVWVRLDTLPSEWVRATVRAVRSGDRKHICCNLHVAFREPCPAGLFDEALGLDPGDGDGPLPSWENAQPPVSLSLPFECEGKGR